MHDLIWYFSDPPRDQPTAGEMPDFATRWQWNHTHERPDSVFGGLTPNQPLTVAIWFLSLPTIKNGELPMTHRLEKHDVADPPPNFLDDGPIGGNFYPAA